MRIDGLWLVCDDRAVRPVVYGMMDRPSGSPLPFYLLVDSGADRTVISADVYEQLGLPSLDSATRLGGVGGMVDSVEVETRLCLMDSQGNPIGFSSRFAVILAAEALDMSVLGRDILNLFAVVLDRSREVVSLVRDTHRYAITGP